MRLHPLFLALCVVRAVSGSASDDITGHGCFEAARADHTFECCDSADDTPCLCQNEVFLGTVMLCIQNEEPDGNIADARSFVKRECNNALKRRVITTSHLRTVLKRANEDQFAEGSKRDLEGKLSRPLVVRGKYDGMSPEAVKLLKDSKKKRKKSDLYAQYFGYGIIGYIALISLLRSISNFAYRALPKVLKAFDSSFCRKVRKHTMLPATFGTKHSHPHYVNGFSFNIPTRQQTLILTVYFIMNFIFMFVGYQTYDWPENSHEIVPEKSWSKVDPTKYLQKQICNRSGILAISQFPLLILFAGRNNFLLWFTGWSLDAFNVFHKWFGRMVVLLLFVHAVAYSIYEGHEKYLKLWGEEAYWRWGVAAFICGAVIVFQSLHFFRALKYEIFLVFHILLAVFFTIGAWHHLIELSYYEYVFAACAVWAFDRFIRLVRIVVSGVGSKAEIKYHDGDVIEMKINYSRLWKFYPGSYAFIHILRWNRFWQNHPFTLIESPKPEDEGKLIMFARTKKGFTRQTKEFLQMQSNTATVNVLVEGPYGSSHPVHKYDNIVMFAGGIGITGVYCYAQSLRKESSRDYKVHFNWVIPDQKPLEWFGDYLDYLQTDDRFEVRIHINEDRELVDEDPINEHENKDQEEKTDSQSLSSGSLKKSYGKPSVYNTVNDHIRNDNGTTAFLVCGPGPMNDEVRKSISENVESAKNRVDYFEESFSW
jgi:predicted ferric reductase